tara:strand:+ start:1470 stop:2198 length:729 start_codon:yes stop_codon:yes gene_type:complete
MALTYDAPTSGAGYPDFETPIGLFWTRWRYPQRAQGNITMINFGRTYVQQLNEWEPEALDTEDLYQSGFYLYEETALERQTPGGLANWQRWYGTIPSAYNTYSFQAVTFPGYYSEFNADAPVSPATSVYRPSLTKVVNVREYHEFVMSTTPWTTWTDPKNEMLLQTEEKAYVGYVDDDTLVNNGGLSHSSSTPLTLTYAEYLEKIAGTGGSDPEIVVKEPEMKRAYGAGNIWELITYYATAE